MATRRIYSVDVPVYATVYIIADSLEEARAKVRALPGDGIDCEDPEQVCGLDFDHPDLPEISFSPAMTIAHDEGVADQLAASIELNEECEVEDEDEQEAA